MPQKYEKEKQITKKKSTLSTHLFAILSFPVIYMFTVYGCYYQMCRCLHC